MQKLFEYIYLGLAIGCMIFMVIRYESLYPDKIVYVLIFMGLFAFLFAFRRTSRIKVEQATQEAQDLNDPEEVAS